MPEFETLTPRSLASACNAISATVESGLWQRAELALRARRQAATDASLVHWAAIMARCPNVLKSVRTVQSWAQAAEFSEKVNRKYKLPISHYVIAARYEERLGLEKIMELMDDAFYEGVSVDSFAADLSRMCQPPPATPFHLGDWLGDMYEVSEKALAAAQTDEEIEAVQAVMNTIDIRKGKLIR